VSNLDIALVQIDVYGSTYTDAAAASAAIRTALDNYSGTVSLTGGGTTKVAGITYTNEMDGYVERPDIFRRITEYHISIKR
jgi:hypothetical protein